MAPKTDEEWDELELPDIVKDWEVGDTLEGFYEGPREIQDFTVGIWRREDGSRWSTALSAGLTPLLTPDLIGRYTRISMTGKKDTGQPSPMKVFKVQVRK